MVENKQLNLKRELKNDTNKVSISISSSNLDVNGEKIISEEFEKFFETLKEKLDI